MNDEYKVVGGGSNPLLLPIKQDAWLRDHEEPGQPRVNPNASYKTWHRLRIGGGGWDSDKWVLWIGVGDQIWPVIAYDIKRWKKGGLIYSNMGKGHPEHYRGTAYSISLETRLDDFTAYEEALNKAEYFIMFAVSPEGDLRTKVWVCQNDHWTNPPQPVEGEAVTKPAKHRRSLVPPEGKDNAPLPEFYFGVEEPPPPPPQLQGVPDLKDVRVMYPGTQGVLTWHVVPASDSGVETECTKWEVNGDEVTMAWRRLGEKYWPFYEVERDGEIEPRYLGNVWLILVHNHGPNQWYGAVPTEQLRWERERNGTAYSIEGHIMNDVTPRPKAGDLVGTFCAGPSRHFPDRPEYRYRGRVEWFIWTTDGKLKRYKPPAGKKPATPTDMRATIGSWNSVRVEWNDNSDNETGFVMEMRHPNGNWVVIGRPGRGKTAFNIVTDPETTYEFRVKATGTSGDSGFSNVATVTTPKKREEPPPSPTGECCAVACASGKKLAELRVGFIDDVMQPVLDAVDEINWPLSWGDLLKIPAAAKKIQVLVPLVERYTRDLRDVENDLLETCKED